MYIYTCIQNRNCRQHSYGFKNLMSSWGLGTQFSKSPLVGEFSIFGSKSKVFQKHMRSQAFFSKIWCYLMGWGRVGTQLGLTCNRVSQVKKQQQKPRCNPYLHCSSGVQRLSIYTTRREAPSLMGRVGRMGRWSKVSFNFLHNLWVYRLCIYLLIYEIKIVTNILMGFKIWCQVGGGGQNFQIYSR